MTIPSAQALHADLDALLTLPPSVLATLLPPDASSSVIPASSSLSTSTDATHKPISSAVAQLATYDPSTATPEAGVSMSLAYVETMRGPITRLANEVLGPDGRGVGGEQDEVGQRLDRIRSVAQEIQEAVDEYAGSVRVQGAKSDSDKSSV